MFSPSTPTRPAAYHAESFGTAGRLQRTRARWDCLGWRDGSAAVYYGWAPQALARFNHLMARRPGCSAPVRAAAASRLRCRADRDPGRGAQGAGDGRLFAVSATDGKQLWEFNTAQDFDTANKVPARGGAIATAGAVIVDGMVYIAWGTRSTAARRRATCCWPSAWTDVPVGITARAALLLTMSAAATSAAAACTASTGGPTSCCRYPTSVLSQGRRVDRSYDSAVVSIAAIMERDLGLPAIQASLYFYADRNAFQQALELDELSRRWPATRLRRCRASPASGAWCSTTPTCAGSNGRTALRCSRTS